MKNNHDIFALDEIKFYIDDIPLSKESMTKFRIF